MQKKCPACQQEKPTTEFGVDRSKPSGFRYRCKACFNKRRAGMNAQHTPCKSCNASQRNTIERVIRCGTCTVRPMGMPTKWSQK